MLPNKSEMLTKAVIFDGEVIRDGVRITKLSVHNINE